MIDPLEQLSSLDLSPSSDLRLALLTKTTCIVRRRRIVRHLARAGVWFGCFLAGAACMGTWQASREETRTLEVKVDLPVVPPTVLVAEAPPSLVDLEWQAFDSRDNRTALYFEVARRYLEEEQDYTSALRCYSQALDAAPKEDLAIRPEDNWLEMALKEVRLKGEQ